MKIPKRVISAFAGLDRDVYLSFAALTGQFFSGWPEGKEVEKQNFQLLRETADLVDSLLTGERSQLSSEELKLFERDKLRQAVNLLREAVIEVYDSSDEPTRSFGDGDTRESTYQAILEFLDQFGSCLIDADAIELPQWRKYWLAEEGLQEEKVVLTAASIPVPFHSKEGRDGLCADFDSTGALLKLTNYSNGRVAGPQLSIDVEDQSAVVREISEFPAQELEGLSKNAADYSVEFYDWLEDKIELICSNHFNLDSAVEDQCSLCKKKQSEVAKLISGPRASVCGDCIELCQEILSEEDRD